VTWFERHPRLGTAGLLLASILGTDVAFSHAYRWLVTRREAPRPTLRVASAVYHHGLRPMLSTDAEHWGPGVYPYRTNSLGFRDRLPRQVELAPRGPRVLFMGDSFTEGVGVAYEQTFVGIVDAAFAARGVEVLNAAVSLYSPTIYYRKTRYLLEDVGLGFDQMVVFIDISDIEDELAFSLDAEGHVALDPRRRRDEQRESRRYGSALWALRPLQRWLDAHTLLLAWVYRGVDGLLARPGHRSAAWTRDPEAFESYGRLGLERARARMEQLRALLAARGVRLTIVVYPWTDQILGRESDCRQERFWREWAAARGAGFLDLFPDFLAAGAPEAVVRRYFIEGDIHWNAAGHALVAAAFLERYDPRPPP